jgi:hypothetical protein
MILTLRVGSARGDPGDPESAIFYPFPQQKAGCELVV